MSSDVEQFLHYRIANAAVLHYPFAHFYIRDIFPSDCYRQMIATLPEQRHYQRLDETGGVPKGAYPERFICDIEQAQRVELDREGAGGIWSDLVRVFRSPEFAHRVLTCFYEAVIKRFGKDSELDFHLDCRLVRDFSNYSISPHTDIPQKLVSLLFYMPTDDSMEELGTSLFVPKDASFRCEGRAHHPFEKFKKVMTAPFLPNSLLGFFKTDNAFHGVERIERERTQRDSILYNIYVRNVGQRAAQS